MTEEYILKLLKKKIIENENIIKIYIEDINLSIQDTSEFFEIILQKLKELEYNVYLFGDTYLFNNKENTVNENEIIIAIK
ncbi:MAG: hypothetical protein Q4G05_04900 [Clostridia bacterium]|nr:hypothetical protein [Clostridia bacterium]